MFTHILLASDGSEHALHAARVAAETAQKFGAKLTALFVFNLDLVHAPFGGLAETPVDTVMVNQYAEDVQAAVEKRTMLALDEFGLAYTTRRELGHPVNRIIAVATETGADLIVLGSRGLGGVESFLLGSVSDRVLHHAHCPVLIVR